MDAGAWWKGIAIGLLVAAPVGPVAVLCIRRTLARGFIVGLLSGLGAATADAVYGAIVAFGLVAVSELLLGQQIWLRPIAGGFLVYLGVRTLRAYPESQQPVPNARELAGTYASTLLLTLANPLTILTFAAILAGLGGQLAAHDYPTASVLVLGVFGGSALWWLGLSATVAALRHGASPRAMRVVNAVSGAVIGGFGLAILANVL